MELKRFQSAALADVESYLSRYLAAGPGPGAAAAAWESHWRDRGVEPDRRYVDRLGGVPDVCVKIPTGGGKTFLACHALAPLAGSLMGGRGLVVWYVPSLAILGQTIRAFRSPEHPYRRALESLFSGRVSVLSKAEALAGTGFTPDSLSRGVTILVASYDSFRSANKEGRKVYRENSSLVAFAAGGEGEAEDSSLVAAIRAQRPLVVVDESHNATSELSVDMVAALAPRFVLELTATPHGDSNIVSIAEPAALKREEMVKLPVIVYNAPDLANLFTAALDMRRKLELLAREERRAGGPYVRPIALFQAEPKGKEDATTFRRVKEKLLGYGIPEEEVRIKTAEIDEIGDVDLLSESCPVRYVITVNALKEGWDCPFAYVLASMADRSSPVDVEQIVGRILRRPYARRFGEAFLNLSYVFTSSPRFYEALDTVVKGLNRLGFGDKDYRAEDRGEARGGATEGSAPAGLLEELEGLTFPPPAETIGPRAEGVEGDDASAGVYSPDGAAAPAGAVAGSSGAGAGSSEAGAGESEAMAAVSALARQAAAEAESGPAPTIAERVFPGVGSVKCYPMREELRAAATALKLPTFRVARSGELALEEGSRELEREDLLADFRLGLESADLALPLAQAELYQVDLEGEESRLSRRRLEGAEADRFLSFIKTMSDADFKRELAAIVMRLLRDVNAVSDRDLKAYVRRVIEGQPEAVLAEMRAEPLRYAEAIRAKVGLLMAEHARRRFLEDAAANAIVAEPAWSFPALLDCAEARRGIPRCLYDAAAPMNGFESQVAELLAGLPNVLFWHRNRERKDFKLNGFINHYPDFIAATRGGNLVLLESKGDDRDNSDSERKLELGREWERLAGPRFKYFMVFQTREAPGAWPMAEAARLIARL